MKKFALGIIIGGLVFGSIGIYASSLYHSRDITYNNENSEVNNVNDALDELYMLESNNTSDLTDYEVIYTGTGNATINYPKDDINYKNTVLVIKSMNRPKNSSYTETNTSAVGVGFTLDEVNKTIKINAKANFKGLQYDTVAVLYDLNYELRYYGDK